MKAGQTNYEVGTRIIVDSIRDRDPDERQGMIGLVGTLTHPFGDMPGTILGVHVEKWGHITGDCLGMAGVRAGLCRGDKFIIVEAQPPAGPMKPAKRHTVR